MIYEKNLRALKQKNENLWSAFLAYQKQKPDTSVFVSAAKNGELIFGYHGTERDYYLNSTYNPTREAEKVMAEYYHMPVNAFLTMFGLANGSFAKIFLKHNQDVGLYVYEPSVEVFAAIMEQIDITDLLQHKLFYLTVEGLNTDDFGNFLFTYLTRENEKTNRYMELPVYAKLFVDSYQRYRQEIRNKFSYYRIQINTWMRTGKQCGFAGIRNMRFLPGCRSGNDYVNYFPKELPVIIVSAGPSLEQNVELLKEVKGKAVILVVDSAIRTVLRHGIEPDFVITVDTNKELKNFEAEGLADVFFLADFTANTKVLDMVKPNNLVFYSTDSGTWRRLFREEGSSLSEVFAGGSVALDAMALAKAWGFKRIIMIGQDLAMTGNRQYADGEKLDAQIEKESEALYVKDIYGNDVLTKPDYYTFIQCIEELAYGTPEIDFIDATEGGARIKHTRIMPLREAIDKYCQTTYDITALKEGVPRRFVQDGKKKVLAALDGMKQHITDLQKQLQQGAEDNTQAADMLEANDFNKETLQEINIRTQKLDKAYEQAEEYGLLKLVAGQANYEFETEINRKETDEIAEAIRLYRNSAKMYSGIVGNIGEILDEIEACKKTMEE